MKKLFFVYIALFLSANVFGRVPERMSYQAVIRDGDNQLVSNQTIGMRISILRGSADGEEVYQETYDPNPTTNANGLVSLEIGSGKPIIGSLSEIDWSTGLYFIKTETDPAGGTNYSVTGVSQLMSVPYALYAEASGTPGPQGPAGQDGVAPDGTAPGEMLYWDGTAWVDVAPGQEGDVLKFIGDKPVWSSATEFTFHGFGYDVVTNPATGKTWLDRNLGAAQAATSPADEDSYGYLYQWGRGTDGHQERSSTVIIALSATDTPGHSQRIRNSSSPYDWRSPQNDNLWQGVNGINNPCPPGFRLPTEAEWEEERQSWTTLDTGGAFDSPLKWPVSGYRPYHSGSTTNYEAGQSGWYWSSTVSGIYAKNIGIVNDGAGIGSSERAYGFSVRCIQN